MLLPSPEIQKRLETYQTIDKAEAKAIKIEQWLMRLHKLGFKAVTATVILGVPTAGYASDVVRNQALQDNSSIIVEKYDDALNKANNNRAIISIDGVGTNNADIVTKFMVPAIRQAYDGQRWSVNQNNAHLTPKAIAEQIIELKEEQGTTSAVFVGESGGGSVTMQVEEIIREESDLEIDGTFFAATPDGLDALQPEQQKNIALIKFISKFPGVKYSTFLRAFGQLFIESDEYMPDGLFSFDLTKCITTLNRINDSIKNGGLPGSWLMIDQELAIEDADIETRTANIGKEPSTVVRPTEVYLEAATDPIVKDKWSSQNIGKYAKKAHIPFFSYLIPHSIHGQPQFSPASYMKVLKNAKDKIQASIRAQISLANLHRVASIFKPTLPKG